MSVAMPAHPNQRQIDYRYPVPPTHVNPPAHPYGTYSQSQYHGRPHTSQYHLPWFSYQHQFAVLQRQYQPQHAPVVVSSHPYAQPVPSISRQQAQTPLIANSQTQPVPSSPPIHSQSMVSPSTPTISMNSSIPPSVLASSQPCSSISIPPQLTRRMPFYPELPWYSVPDAPFPPRANFQRRRRREPKNSRDHLEFPTRQQSNGTETVVESLESQKSILAVPMDAGTPDMSEVLSEFDSTHPTTPSSTLTVSSTPRARITPGHSRTQTRPVVPLVLKKPSVSGGHSSQVNTPIENTPSTGDKMIQNDQVQAPAQPQQASEVRSTLFSSSKTDATSTATMPSKPVQKTWADLVRTNTSTPKDAASSSTTNGLPNVDFLSSNKSRSLGEVLRSYSVFSEGNISFLEPRGLVNTGNMCYMNSILQVLIFCVPFFDFLDQVRKRAVQSFKNETPLVDALIMFIREFPVIESAVSAAQLRQKIKNIELERYGEAFSPEYLYDVIKCLPQFSFMQRGHQQDAEEFLGFLLAGLHDECVQLIRSLPHKATADNTSHTGEVTPPNTNSWLEVGPRQRTAVTRSSGIIETESPITKIFGGKLRSELRVPGLKDSVTLEPYQPLQLDIGSPNVKNISDALRGLTRPEVLHGDFKSPYGPGTSATKQVFIESLPPVLVLHLKRFQYENSGGTQKIWKRIGYPLELEIPKEVFPPSRYTRAGLAARDSPRYRLTGIVYHHGKNASGGHYTVDVRRQDDCEWIRIDDTTIRRVKSSEVAEGGTEEEPVASRCMSKRNKRGNQACLEGEFRENGDEKWDQTNDSAHGPGTGKRSTLENGAANGVTRRECMHTPTEEPSVKDRVAYILFYQRMKM